MNITINYLQSYERIKHVISKRVAGNITDAKVADTLKIKPATFATMKNRGAFPYENIIHWCINNNIDIYYILFDKGEGVKYEYKI